MRKKTVLVDIFYLHVAQTGIKTYIETLCSQIDSNPETRFHFVISPKYAKVKTSGFFKGNTPKWKNLLFQVLYLSRKLFLLPIISWYQRADIILSPDILSPIWGRGLKISVIHDAFFWENPGHYHPVWLKTYLFLLKCSLAKRTGIITISEYSKKRIAAHLDIAGIPMEAVYPSTYVKPKPLTKASIPPLDSPYFLHVGVMEKRKNLVTLINAYEGFIAQEKFRHYKLVLVGQRGPRKTLDDYDHIIQTITSKGLEESVLLPGYVDQMQMDNYYRHAFAYVFPSLNEGFGMPILEAFSYRIPVIIANQGALKEVGGDGVLMVEKNTAEAFKAAMVALAQDPIRRDTLIKAGSDRLKRFGEDRFFISLQASLAKITHGYQNR
jgi:glycosyltransferase involved in cell wall biosynthesis